MKTKITKLTTQELEKLKKRFESFRFKTPFHLVYEKQIPNTGIVLLDGEIELLKRKKIEEKVTTGSILGIYHLLNNVPVKHSYKINENSEVILIQKSDILQAIHDEDSELHELIPLKEYQKA